MERLFVPTIGIQSGGIVVRRCIIGLGRTASSLKPPYSAKMEQVRFSAKVSYTRENVFIRSKRILKVYIQAKKKPILNTTRSQLSLRLLLRQHRFSDILSLNLAGRRLRHSICEEDLVGCWLA
jgi:hypothetical protein